MIRIKQSVLLVVSSTTSAVPVPSNKKVIHITDATRLFPAIHQHQPDGIILDHDHLSANTERVLRRLNANPFYHKIKVSCYKSKPHTKVDDLLKTLGVQKFIYAEDTKSQLNQAETAVNKLSEILESSVMGSLAKPIF